MIKEQLKPSLLCIINDVNYVIKKSKDSPIRDVLINIRDQLAKNFDEQDYFKK